VRSTPCGRGSAKPPWSRASPSTIDVVGIFPNEQAIIRLVGDTLPEQDDERTVPRARSMTLETIAPFSEHRLVGLPTVAA
jgi:putative transposase